MCTGQTPVPAAVAASRGRPALDRGHRGRVPPLTPHGPRNPILLIYRTTGGTGLNGTIKTGTTIGRVAGTARLGRPADPPRCISTGDPAERPARRQGGEE